MTKVNTKLSHFLTYQFPKTVLSKCHELFECLGSWNNYYKNSMYKKTYVYVQARHISWKMYKNIFIYEYTFILVHKVERKQQPFSGDHSDCEHILQKTTKITQTCEAWHQKGHKQPTSEKEWSLRSWCCISSGAQRKNYSLKTEECYDGKKILLYVSGKKVRSYGKNQQNNKP